MTLALTLPVWAWWALAAVYPLLLAAVLALAGLGAPWVYKVWRILS